MLRGALTVWKRATARGAWVLVAVFAVTATVGVFAHGGVSEASGAPEEVRIPPLKSRPMPPPATFSHWGHNHRQCYSCHPTVFPQSRMGFTHQDMQAGQFCGACHDGARAKAVIAMKCEGCHAP
ncbi:MAG: cytochrome c3 family protein [Polyangiales bacterium]|nr:hypothetical protein [Myxococcales bacterium]